MTPDFKEHMFALVARRLVPRRHRAWLTAMLMEAEHIDPASRLEWLRGSLAAALKMRLREHAFALALVGAAGGIVLMDWNTANDLATLSVLILSAMAFGYARPTRVFTSAASISAFLFVTHGLADVSGVMRPFYQCDRLTFLEYVILASLILPAMAGAMAGASLSRVVDH